MRGLELFMFMLDFFKYLNSELSNCHIKISSITSAVQIKFFFRMNFCLTFKKVVNKKTQSIARKNGSKKKNR